MKLFLTEPDNHFTDSIYQLFKESDHELLSLMPIYENEDEDDSGNLETIHQIHGQSLNEIFKNYYLTKYPEANEIPESIFNRFNDLINEVNSED